MKNPACLALALAVAVARAQQNLPEPKPVNGAAQPIIQPAAKEAAPAAGKPAEPPEPSPKQLSSQEAADALSEDELRQVVDILRDNYLHPDALGETALARAGIQGLLDRLGTGARIFSATTNSDPKASQFHSETLNGTVGYLRLGALTAENLGALDGVLETYAAKPPVAAVLDLRATPHSTD